MADQSAGPRARGDEAELFRAYNDQLMRAVARSTFATSPQIVEDACAFAWTKFMENQPDRDRNWRGWLFRVAEHEVWALDRAAREHVPVGSGGTSSDRVRAVEPTAPHNPFETWIELDDALSVLRELPPRLQRIGILRALGLSHRDIGQLTGDSPTRVGQLVRRAHFGVGEIQTERAQAEAPLPLRAQRLRDLEREPPAWLVEVIGGRPRSIKTRSQHSNERRAWRRAALALDDYRRHAGDQALRSDGLSRAPADREGRCLHARAVAAVDDLMQHRGRDDGREAAR